VNFTWLWYSVSCYGPDCKPEGPLFSPAFVCLCVCVCLSVCLSVCLCLWRALLPFNVDWFWWNLVTRTLLWSSLAATITVQVGRRGTARRLFENFKKFSKITEFECQNAGRSFFVSVSPVYCKKKLTRFEQNDGGDTFWSLPFRQPPADRSVQRSGSRRQRCAGRPQRDWTEMLRPHHSVDSDHRSANWGHSDLGRNQAVKTNRLVLTVCNMIGAFIC